MTTVNSLPVELLESILSHLSTPTLFHISPVSHAIHASAHYLIHQRFRRLQDLNGHNLIFECSLPSERRTTPYHTCTHTGTHPLAKQADSRCLSAQYAHFAPLPVLVRALPFDAGVYFTQLIASAVLAKRVDGTASVVGVCAETVFRMRRSWLREVVKEGRVLWLGEGENFGLRLGVKEVHAGGQGRRRRMVWQREEEEGERETGFEVGVEEVVVRMGWLAGKVEEEEEEMVKVVR